MAETKGGAFIGYPRAPKPAKGFRKTYADTWLDDFIKGLLGDSEPSGGTVLDPEDKSRRNRVKDLGEQASIVTSIPSQLMGLGALPLLSGAIRKGGAKDLFAMHGTHASNLPKIAESGFLKSPSIGITSRRPNDYASGPQLIFAPDKTDPARVPGTLTNRDGYTYNPFYSSKNDPELFKQEIENQIKDLNKFYGVDDLRLGQYFPGLSQGFSIGASPKFKSYAEFEQSPGGAAVLRMPERTQQPYWRGIERDLGENAELMRSPSPEQYAKELIKRALTHGPEHMTGFERQLWDRASRAPSSMAEMKVHGDLPINPKDTALFLPNWDVGTLEKAAQFRDEGFQIFNPYNLARDFRGHKRDRPYNITPQSGDVYAKRLARVPDARTGGFNLPKDKLLTSEDNVYPEAREAWNDFITGGKAGGSPPLMPPKLGPKSEIESWLSDFDDPKLAEGQLQIKYENGSITDQEYEAGVKFLDKKFPVKPLGKASESLADMFGIPKMKASAETKAALPDDWTKGMNPDSSLQLSKDKLPAFANLMNEADEYLITLEDFVKTHSVKPGLHDQLMDKTWELYLKGLHDQPSWHKKLETALTETLVHAPFQPKLAVPASKLTAEFEAHKTKNPDFPPSTLAHSFLSDKGLFKSTEKLLDEAKKKAPVPKGLGNDYDEAAKIAVKEGADPLAIKLWMDWYKAIWEPLK
jgi:hypothetical protein